MYVTVSHTLSCTTSIDTLIDFYAIIGKIEIIM